MGVGFANVPFKLKSLSRCAEHSLCLPDALLAPQVSEWRDKALAPYLGVFVDAATLGNVAQTLADKCFAEVQVKSTEYFDDEEGEELCNCEFSLAYGAKILLNNAALRLKRGRRYGLCGPNGVGKVRICSLSHGQARVLSG